MANSPDLRAEKATIETARAQLDRASEIFYSTGGARGKLDSLFPCKARTLEDIGYIEGVAEDPAEDEQVRDVAREGLVDIEAGRIAASGARERVNAARADLRRREQDAQDAEAERLIASVAVGTSETAVQDDGLSAAEAFMAELGEVLTKCYAKVDALLDPLPDAVSHVARLSAGGAELSAFLDIAELIRARLAGAVAAL